MKRLLLTLFASLGLAAGCLATVTFPNEKLSYRVTYKWGIVQKVAGSANITLNKLGNNYSAKLTARSQPWADKIFMVRDTLSGTMRGSDMSPLTYTKSTHEAKDYRHDTIKYTYSGNRAVAKTHRIKRDKKGKITKNDSILTANSPATDMLSVYYFVRRLPFETMKPGTVTRANIFSGKKIEKLAVTYDGIENVNLNDKIYKCYKIHFRFSSERIKDSSKPMKAWLETTGTHRPVKLEGELPIGKIQILLNDK